LKNDVSSFLSYKELHEFQLPSVYKLCAISKAAGILTHYRKQSKRHNVNKPYCTRLNLLLPGKLHMPGNVDVPSTGTCNASYNSRELKYAPST